MPSSTPLRIRRIINARARITRARRQAPVASMSGHQRRRVAKHMACAYQARVARSNAATSDISQRRARAILARAYLPLGALV